MKTIIASIIIASATITRATPAEDREWATRIPSELQTAGPQSLPTLTFSQGSTPLLSLDQYRSGRAVDAATNGVYAVFQFGASATSQYYVAVTNYATVGNGYLVQLPTIGTNTTSGAWWYTAYYMRGGRRYWTGNGRLNIVETTSTADGLHWQEIACGAEVDPVALPVASNALALASTALHAEVDPVAYPVATNALALASTALQPAATNGLLRAEADTLATVTARGATTLDAISARNFIGGRYGAGAGESAYGYGWGAYGENAGSSATGDYWGAYGVSAGSSANGNAWGAYGTGAGSLATGDEWGAYGVNAGYGADHNKSHAFGNWAGFAARGDLRLYIDVYAAAPEYAANGAINDRIFGDTDGKLYLGRGEGAPGGAVGGTLRGPWTGGGFASYLAATNIAAAAVAGSGHAIAEQVVTGAVCTASAGNRYFWTSATNVVLSVNLTSGQVVNLAKLNNTATNSITAIGQVGWEWTGGDMTNTIAAGKSMTFGFLIDAATGKTNAYATGVSK